MRKLAGHFTQTTVMTFHDLGLDESILKSIDEFGFTTPTPIQAGSIPHIIEGKDVIGSAQTGTGKTAAYALRPYMPIAGLMVDAGGYLPCNALLKKGLPESLIKS